MDDEELRQHLYSETVRLGYPPHSTEVATSFGATQEEVLEGFQRLRSSRLLYLAPDTGEIVMAPPFSATPTPFLVTTSDKSYFANCVWDSYGVLAALHADGTVRTGCACCGQPMTLAVIDGRPVPTVGIAHFAIPAAQWWGDLTYT